MRNRVSYLRFNEKSAANDLRSAVPFSILDRFAPKNALCRISTMFRASSASTGILPARGINTVFAAFAPIATRDIISIGAYRGGDLSPFLLVSFLSLFCFSFSARYLLFSALG